MIIIIIIIIYMPHTDSYKRCMNQERMSFNSLPIAVSFKFTNLNLFFKKRDFGREKKIKEVFRLHGSKVGHGYIPALS